MHSDYIKHYRWPLHAWVIFHFINYMTIVTMYLMLRIGIIIIITPLKSLLLLIYFQAERNISNIVTITCWLVLIAYWVFQISSHQVSLIEFYACVPLQKTQRWHQFILRNRFKKCCLIKKIEYVIMGLWM